MALSFIEAMQSRQAGIDAQYSQQATQDQSSILSDKAAQSKLATQEMQQASSTRMATMAAQSKAQIDNLQIDSTTLEGQDKIYDMAIKSMVPHPDVQESLRAKKTANLQEMANNSTRQSKMRGEQADQKANVITEALLDPEAGSAAILEMAAQTGDKQLQGLGLALSGKVPVPKKYTDGATLSYNQLSPAQKDALHNSIRQAFPGGQREKTVHDVQLEMATSARNIEQRSRADEKKQYDSQTTAAKQQGLEISKELADAKVASAGQQLEISKLVAASKKAETIGKLQKVLDETPETKKNPEATWATRNNPLSSIPNTIPNPAIARIQGQIDKLQGTDTSTTKPTLTKEDTVAIEWAKAHPTDPNAKTILEHHKDAL